MSNFIEIVDYEASIHAEILNAIIRNDETIVDIVEDQAIAEMRGYLAGRFDCDAIFAKTKTDRNSLILMFAKDIVIYHLFCIHNPMKLSQVRKDRYDRAIEWLKGVQKGTIIADGLPESSSDSDSSGSDGTGIIISSNDKRNNHF